MSFENVCYKNSVLVQVIIRVDILEFIPSEILFSEEVLKTVLSSFPSAGMRQVIRFNDVNVVLNDVNATTRTNSQEGYQQEFSDSKNNKLKVSNKFIILEVNNYESFEKTISLLSPIMKELMSAIPFNSVRTGIRYINIVGNGGLRLTKNLFASSIGYLVNNDRSWTCAS